MITDFQRILIIRIAMILSWIAIIFLFLSLSELLPFKSESKTINVFAWSGMFDLKYIAQFEKRTGIKVNFSYYESNEELLAKLRATQGKGYDLIIPSDYTVNILRQEGLLKKLDKQKMPFFSKFNSILLGHYYDPNNEYSVPFEWAIFGLGIDKSFFGSNVPKATWGLVFDPLQIPSRVIMVNDPLVAIPIASFYLFKSLQNIDEKKLESIKQLLITQKKQVEAYADFRADYYLATKNCPIVVASSSYIWRSMREYPYIDFIIPQEGTLVTIESCAIPISSTKDDFVYEFMQFIFAPESVMHSFEQFAFFPTTTDVIDKLTVNDTVRSLLTMSSQQFSRFSFFKMEDFCKPITEQHLQDLWVMVKST